MDNFLFGVFMCVFALFIGMVIGKSHPDDITAVELTTLSALCDANAGLHHLTVRQTTTVKCNNGAEFRP